MIESWVSDDDITSHLEVTKATVYVWIADNRMPVHRVWRVWRFQASEVDRRLRSDGAPGPHDGSDDT